MPGALVTALTQVQCPHVGKATTVPKNTRVTVMGGPVLTVTDLTAVAGCPFQIPVGAGTKPSPCVKVLWQSSASARVKIMGQPAVLATPPGVGQSPEQAPQGPAAIVPQTRVVAI